jgi:FAD/FMN-containing dehydrogenase
LKPSSTEEVSDILKYCYDKNLAVVPQGGNTGTHSIFINIGLVGGSVPLKDEIIISLTRMNKILSFDQNFSIVKTEAGVILEKLKDYLATHGYMPPIDLGARGSCHIGGNLATNAGGMKFLKYNSLHANTIGLKAVLADGTILDDMKALRKDNTGYDLKQIFIGSEGTLGIITEAAILCPKIPASSNVALLACDSFENVVKVLSKAKNMLADNLTSIEYFDRECIKMVKKNLGHQNPLGYDHKFNILVEVSDFDHQNPNSKFVEDKLFGLFEDVLFEITDGVVAQDSAQAAKIWTCRETIVEGFIKEGINFKYDFSLPIDSFDEFVKQVRDKLGDQVITGGYGHIGDGNIHVSVTTLNIHRSMPQLKDMKMKHFSPNLKNKLSHGSSNLCRSIMVALVQNMALDLIRLNIWDLVGLLR